MRVRKKSVFAVVAFLAIVIVYSILNYNIRAFNFRRGLADVPPAAPTVPPDEQTLYDIYDNYRNSSEATLDTLADDLMAFCDNRTEQNQDHVTRDFTSMRSSTAPSIGDKRNKKHNDRTLLTLFTTIKDAKLRICIHINTFRNWQLLKPFVRPVLVTTGQNDSLYATLALRFGWQVIRASKLIHKIPVLRYMYYDIGKAYSSVFYGYANADILFDMNLVNTLRTIETNLFRINTTMIIGQRTNYHIHVNEAVYTFNDVQTAAQKGKLFQLNAEDYFITTKNGFPWNAVPDYVVGRPGYDNCVVYIGVRDKVSVIDTSKTILAVHQSPKGGDFTGFQNKDVGVNWRMWRLCDIMLGHINCAKLETERDFGGDIRLRHRKSTCKPSRRLRKLLRRKVRN